MIIQYMKQYIAFYIVFLVAIILGVAFYGSSSAFKQSFLRLLTASETNTVLTSDDDNYYQTFTPTDLSVRNVDSVEEYVDKIKNVGIDINEDMLTKINTSLNKINSHFKDDDTFYGVDMNVWKQIPWNIGVFDGGEYESGLPHTRNDVILLPLSLLYSKQLTKVLVHEKTHVYQKLYPEKIRPYISKHYKVHSKKADVRTARANPDVDNYIYSDHNGTIYSANYESNPKDMFDIQYAKGDKEYEHPYETMAYNLEKKI